MFEKYDPAETYLSSWTPIIRLHFPDWIDHLFDYVGRNPLRSNFTASKCESIGFAIRGSIVDYVSGKNVNSSNITVPANDSLKPFN